MNQLPNQQKLRLLVAVMPMCIIVILAFVSLTKILSGEIGNMETWRVAASITSTSILSLFLLVALVRVAKKWRFGEAS